MPGRRFDSFGSGSDAPERPSDPAVRKANFRRIFPLFREYKRRLAVAVSLIIVSAAIGVIPPFLLREVLDVAIPDQNTTLLTWLVLGLIAIPIISGAVLVYVTLLSSRMGHLHLPGRWKPERRANLHSPPRRSNRTLADRPRRAGTIAA
ncbi:MAG: hypothetical protein M3546_07520 [Actinomycetota bacterium]|nr:hypothetical protein [Actinomycetota bacterium]